MKKFVGSLMVLAGLMATPVSAEGYSGFALGLGEPCRGVGDTGLTDGECRDPGILARVFVGHAVTDFFRLEGTLDALLDPRWLFGSHGNTHVTALTLGGYALMNVPFTDEVSFFAGPGVATSMVHVSWDYRSYYDDGTQERYETSERDTTFGFNYGWTAGVEFEIPVDSVVRIQWQTWRSMDSDVLYDDEFSMNYLSLSLRKAF